MMPRLITTTLAALLWAQPVGAQDLEGVCEGAQELSVGQWAEYEVDGFGGTKLKARYAIVGEESAEGHSRYWLEMTLPTGGMLMQLQISGYPFPPDGVHKVLMKVGDSPAMEYPKEMAAQMGSEGQNLSEPIVKACNESELVGWETVSVPAGEFRALRVKVTIGGGDKEIWLSSDVPFGMVKMAEMTDDQGLVLIAHGMDAKSSITETPVKLGDPNQR